MIYCNKTLNLENVKSIYHDFAEQGKIKIIPFLINDLDEVRLFCPCCVLDRRADVQSLMNIQSIDEWSSRFTKHKCKIHSFNLTDSPIESKIENGLSIESLKVRSSRERYSSINRPILRRVGFKGFKFDRQALLPIGVIRNEDNSIRAGIVNPSMLENLPLLHHISGSWLMRVTEVLPRNIPNLLPIRNIGDITFSDAYETRTISNSPGTFTGSSLLNLIESVVEKKKGAVPSVPHQPEEQTMSQC